MWSDKKQQKVSFMQNFSNYPENNLLGSILEKLHFWYGMMAWRETVNSGVSGTEVQRISMPHSEFVKRENKS